MYIVWIIFTAAVLVLLSFYIFCFLRLARYRTIPPGSIDLPPVSVIICAKNEAQNLERYLPAVLEQNYPDFEVIVVDDGSDDQTPRVLTRFAADHKHLRIIGTDRGALSLNGKRKALQTGVESAVHNCLVLTDADCRPASARWLQRMAQHFTRSKRVVLGYSPVEKGQKEGWLGRFLRYDAFYTALQYGSFYLAGCPYMGVGRNLAYDKRLFKQVKGFQNPPPTVSGDDDLLINKIATSKNTALELHPDSFVYTAPLDTWRQLFQQKTRHLSTAFYYRPVHKILLGLLACSQFCFYVCLAVFIISQAWLIYVLAGYTLKTLVQFLIFKNAMKKLQVNDLWKYLPLLDALYLCLYMILLSRTFFKKSDRW